MMALSIRPTTVIVALLALRVSIVARAAADDVCFYAGGTAATRFECVHRLSDGTVLIGGATTDLAWVASGVPHSELTLPNVPNDKGTGKIAFVLHVSSDLQRPLAVAYFKAGAAEDIHRIRTTGVPGHKTGDLYVSGINSAAVRNSSGYFIARLDHNFLDAAPQKVAWARAVWAEGELRTLQPWDVGTDGKVYFASGVPYSYDWAEVGRLKADGTDDTVENWRVHDAKGPDGKDQEEQFTPLSSRPDFHATRSAIVMKFWGRGSLRSWTKEDYKAILPDGNGATKQGRWPDDYYFKVPFDPKDPQASQVGPGYTGYNIGSPCPRVGDIAVDRATGNFYVGYSVQSRLPDGGPDFEPAVVAMDPTGKLMWWSRLYRETKQNSTPDQYVDRLAVDYAGKYLVVQARCHGNNTYNYWKGNEVAADPKATGFQNSFTGSNGNIHVCWLGKLTLAQGTLHHATYVAEYVDGMEGTGPPSGDPVLDGWPSPNSGWPQLNTTRVHDLAVDEQGRVYVVGVGRRVITTANAYQKMPKKAQGKSAWSFFARVYDPDLSSLAYSSILNGPWPPEGNGDTTAELAAITPTASGFVTVGTAATDEKTGKPVGAPVPTGGVPRWGESTPRNQNGLAARLLMDPAR